MSPVTVNSQESLLLHVTRQIGGVMDRSPVMVTNTELYKSSFSFSGPKVWNSLPNEIKTSKTVFEFKNSYKLLNF